MNHSELPPADARNIVRRYVHDLNNLANCLQLELSLLEEDLTALPSGESFHKLSRQVAQLEFTIRSLAVRFAEPSACVVSAFDVFQSWRDKIDQSGYGVAVNWEPSATNPLINVDFNAVLTVLREICLYAKNGERPRARNARLYESGDSVVFEVTEAMEKGFGANLNGAAEIPEWQRITAASGGIFQCSCDENHSRCRVSLSFPIAASPPALFRDS